MTLKAVLFRAAFLILGKSTESPVILVFATTTVENMGYSVDNYYILWPRPTKPHGEIKEK